MQIILLNLIADGEVPEDEKDMDDPEDDKKMEGPVAEMEMEGGEDEKEHRDPLFILQIVSEEPKLLPSKCQ